MHPTPHRQTAGEAGRIISLGDVRRRRAGRSRAPDGPYLAALALSAVGAWACWLVVLLAIPPSRLLTYVAFFAPLWIAITATGALASYGVTWKRGSFPSLRSCVRHGSLAASLVVLNLAVAAAHRWSVVIGFASLAAATAAEVLVSRRST